MFATMHAIYEQDKVLWVFAECEIKRHEVSVLGVKQMQTDV